MSRKLSLESGKNVPLEKAMNLIERSIAQVPTNKYDNTEKENEDALLSPRHPHQVCNEIRKDIFALHDFKFTTKLSV
jgi:hypothetical protein